VIWTTSARPHRADIQPASGRPGQGRRPHNAVAGAERLRVGWRATAGQRLEPRTGNTRARGRLPQLLGNRRVPYQRSRAHRSRLCSEPGLCKRIVRMPLARHGVDPRATARTRLSPPLGTGASDRHALQLVLAGVPEACAAVGPLMDRHRTSSRRTCRSRRRRTSRRCRRRLTARRSPDCRGAYRHRSPP